MVYSNIAAKFVNEAALTESAVDPLQFVLESEQEDLKMFNALIEVDFAEVYSENGSIYLSEADKNATAETAKKTLGQKILDAIHKFIAMVKKFFTETIPMAISKLVQRDKTLVKKYEKYMKWENVKNCPAKGNTVDMKKYEDMLKTTADLLNNSSSAPILAKIETASSAEAIKEIVDDYAKVIEEAKKKFGGEDGLKADDIIDKSDEAIAKKISSNDFFNILNEAKGGFANLRKELNKTYKSIEDQAKKEEADAKKNRKSDDELVAAKLNAKYQTVGLYHSLTSMALTFYKAVTQKYIATHRANFIILGNYAVKKGDPDAIATGVKTADVAKKAPASRKIEKSDDSTAKNSTSKSTADVFDDNDNDYGAWSPETDDDGNLLLASAIIANAYALTEMSNNYVESIFEEM